jgi:hypothetical protein
MTANPPWAQRLLERRQPAIAAAFERADVPLDWLPYSGGYDELGCGHYGCVFATRDDDVVFKLTTDGSEAQLSVILLDMQGCASAVTRRGLVRYHGTWVLSGERHHGRPVYVVVRQAAHHVGMDDSARRKVSVPGSGLMVGPDSWLWYGYTLMTTFPGVGPATAGAHIAEFGANLMEFLRFASIARSRCVNRDWNSRWAALQRAVHAQDEEFDIKDLKGRDAFPAALHYCYVSAGHLLNNPFGIYVGAVLAELLLQGILLADVHANNLGHIRRAGADRKLEGQPVIIDPGHAVLLKKEWSRIEVPEI